MIRRLNLEPLLLGTLFLCFTPAYSEQKYSIPLALDDRIHFQRAIEQVYRGHRIWPKENKLPRPALDAVMPEASLRAKVEDYLRKSNALDIYWQRPITPQQLQAELDRMIRDTQQPAILRELFAALNNDATIIAECLARPILADRLIHNRYAGDERFHGALKRKAELELAITNTTEAMRALSGDFHESVWKRQQDAGRTPESDADGSILLNPQEWKEWTGRLQRQLGGLPAGKVSRLLEDADRYYVIAILEKSDARVRLATVEWKKRPFDEWWNEAKIEIPSENATPLAAYNLSDPPSARAPAVDDTWSATYSGPPTGRNAHTAVWTGTEMIVWGGVDDSGYTNTGGRYNPAIDYWSPGNTSISNAPAARRWHTAVWTGTEMIVWGGSNGTDQSTGGRYNPASDTWAAGGTSMTNAPAARSFHTAVWTGAEMIVWGGSDGTTLNTGGRYDPATDTWAAGGTSTTNAPGGRFGHTAIWTTTEMIVWGGADAVGYTNTGGRYNPATNTWAAGGTSTTDAPTGRYFHTAVWTGTEMIVWGGHWYDGVDHYENTGGLYDPAAGTWTAGGTGTTNAPTGRTAHTAIWTSTQMIIWGGYGIGGPFNTGGRYTPAANIWTAGGTATTNAPTGREEHTAVWTGAEMIVWGGVDSVGRTKTGGRYSPSGNTWIAGGISLSNEPNGRYGHTTVWTGTEMIIWGGYEGTYLNSGGSYDPATNAWAVGGTTTINAPTGRRYHAAVWTGTEMIIWGGKETGAYTNTGGRFNPATNTWAAAGTSTTDAPTARDQQTAVWTGTEMIVWGGFDAVTPGVNTGGRYTPATDSWVAGGTSTTNAPTGRWSHTAVWTGAEMIVWGGYDGTYPNTGGRYNPAANTWASGGTTTANAPTGRQFHTAVWTGAEMIIWGGGDAGSSFNTGGRYNPITDAWAAGGTSTIDAPTIRFLHTAVWTGAEMIIWGGYDGLNDLNTGGRYNPASDHWASGGTSTTNAPSARDSHTAIWTGTEMIVWGGNNSIGGNENTGGRYTAVDPCTGVTISLSALTDGVQYQPYFQTITASGGTAPYTFAVTSGALPAGLTLDSATGVISGTPTAVQIASFTITATDASGCAGSQPYVVSIVCPAITLSPTTLPDGAVGVSYNQTVSASGGTAPYTFAVTAAGNLPDGLTLNSTTGVISGIPTTLQTASFTIRATDANGCTGSRPYVVNIVCPSISLSPATLPDVTLGNTYDQTVAASGGSAPYTFSLSGGLLPVGLSMNSAGHITGTAIAEGAFNFTITATDALGCSGSHDYSINVACPAITLSPTTLPDGTAGAAYDQTVSASGGTAPYTLGVSGGFLPNGLAMDASGHITGTPTLQGAFNFTITATDSFGCTGSQAYTVNITAPSCLYCDDFEDGVLANWTYIKQGWSESGGDLVGTPTGKKAVAVAIPVFAGCLNCSVEATMQTAGGIGNKVWMLGWYVDKKNNVELLMSQEKGKWLLKQRFNGTVVNKAKGFGTILPNVFYDVVVSFDGTQFTVTVDGTQVLQMTPVAAVPSGTVGFEVKGTTARFGEIIVN